MSCIALQDLKEWHIISLYFYGIHPLWFYLGLHFLGSSLYRFVSFFYPFKKPSDLLHILNGFSFISDLTFILSVLCMHLLHRLSITSDVLSLGFDVFSIFKVI